MTHIDPLRGSRYEPAPAFPVLTAAKLEVAATSTSFPPVLTTSPTSPHGKSDDEQRTGCASLLNCFSLFLSTMARLPTYPRSGNANYICWIAEAHIRNPPAISVTPCPPHTLLRPSSIINAIVSTHSHIQTHTQTPSACVIDTRNTVNSYWQRWAV
ncbi:hypothetical protein LZ30DRAFT_114913 [Colletotrichum cereale]|nr:hypothetical protein LZ30DRAFT_114913 [Colletotrichum cereale]